MFFPVFKPREWLSCIFICNFLFFTSNGVHFQSIYCTRDIQILIELFNFAASHSPSLTCSPAAASSRLGLSALRSSLPTPSSSYPATPAQSRPASPHLLSLAGRAGGVSPSFSSKVTARLGESPARSVRYLLGILEG
jgi:hypothetical protein